MRYTNTYAERQDVPDVADLKMQKYLKHKGLKEYKDWLKIGTDPKENKLNYFWLVTAVINIPDYCVVVNKKVYLVEVKGTKRIKESDYIKLEELHRKAEPYDEVFVGIMYFGTGLKKPMWIPFSALKGMWEDKNTIWGYYEKDFLGNPKLYKILPI